MDHITPPIKVAIIGCGYISAYYTELAKQYTKNFKISTVCDIDSERANRLSSVIPGSRAVSSLKCILEDPEIKLIINLTPPEEHFKINKESLIAGKNVYCEKPLALNINEVKELCDLAKNNSLLIQSAPCLHHGDAVKATRHIINQGGIGNLKFVDITLDDGRMEVNQLNTLKNYLGIAWPLKEELECGCNIEHSGYVITLLTYLFGGVKRINTISDKLSPSNEFATEIIYTQKNDYVTALLTFETGLKARVTVSYATDHERSMRVYGSRGKLTLVDIWDNNSLLLSDLFQIESHQNTEHYLETPAPKKSSWYFNMDLCAAVNTMCNSIQSGIPDSNLMSADQILHIMEVVLLMQKSTHGSEIIKNRFIPTATSPMVKNHYKPSLPAIPKEELLKADKALSNVDDLILFDSSERKNPKITFCKENEFINTSYILKTLKEQKNIILSGQPIYSKSDLTALSAGFQLSNSNIIDDFSWAYSQRFKRILSFRHDKERFGLLQTLYVRCQAKEHCEISLNKALVEAFFFIFTCSNPNQKLLSKIANVSLENSSIDISITLFKKDTPIQANIKINLVEPDSKNFFYGIIGGTKDSLVIENLLGLSHEKTPMTSNNGLDLDMPLPTNSIKSSPSSETVDEILKWSQLKQKSTELFGRVLDSRKMQLEIKEIYEKEKKKENKMHQKTIPLTSNY